MKRQLLKRFLLLSAAVATVALSGFSRQPEQGYRGFVDWTNRIYHHTFENVWEGQTHYYGQTYYCPGISTSHGYQFNPWLFAGGGIDYTISDGGRWYDKDHWVNHSHHLQNYYLSIFGEVRTDLQFGKFTPFADIRLGWNATSNGTVYFSPSIGYRFNWGRKVGINVGVGYTLDAYRYEKHIWGQTPEGLTILVPTGEYFNRNISSFTFRVGIDF